MAEGYEVERRISGGIKSQLVVPRKVSPHSCVALFFSSLKQLRGSFFRETFIPRWKYFYRTPAASISPYIPFCRFCFMLYLGIWPRSSTPKYLTAVTKIRHRKQTKWPF